MQIGKMHSQIAGDGVKNSAPVAKNRQQASFRRS